MDKQFFFERNLLALDRDGDNLCERLSAAVTTKARYRMLESRDGRVIPSMVDAGGRSRPLHSLIDPAREAERLVSSISGAGFLLFLGLGGGYQIEAALKNGQVAFVVIVDFDIDGIAEILSSKDFVGVFNDKRVSLLVDPSVAEVERKILGTYNPLLHGNMRSIPLKTRCDAEKNLFLPVVNAVNAAIEKISLDYSVQAQFGKRWFSNIIRNIILSEKQRGPVPPVADAAICAAGPSLDGQMGRLKARRRDLFVIATDTAFLTLVNNGIVPDAVIAIDCQHIGYRHFIGNKRVDPLFFLDIAAPPHLASLSALPYFFADAHPLSGFVSKYYKSFPQVDVSGGNVTYAAVSLAAALRAKRVELYGADFSYPEGKTYTRGAYIYPYFDCRQDRFQPAEALFSSFVFRTKVLTKQAKGAGWFYQTPSLLMYKNRLSDLSARVGSVIIPVEGDGDTVSVLPKNNPEKWPARFFSTGANRMSAGAFLRFYHDAVDALPALCGSVDGYLSSLSPFQTEVFCTLIPSGASVKAGREAAVFAEVLEDTKRRSTALIQRVLAAHAV
ncbi:MAG: DUF115 domain-containing protein [Spirochaetaceae bacterium]|jgi:hypothetical protein|nr:DUF115 domain-containing protein [Spirochaetaceae bacterium]